MARICNRKLAQRIEYHERLLTTLRVYRRGEIPEAEFISSEDFLKSAIAEDEKTLAFTGYDRKGRKLECTTTA